MNDLQDEKFPEGMEKMTSLRWLKLNNANLKQIPAEIGSLSKLEHLTVKKNKLESISSQLSHMPCLRTLNLRYNNLTHKNIPPQVFENEELSTLDLSHNQLTEVPEGLMRCKSLLVLNLSHNQIEMVP